MCCCAKLFPSKGLPFCIQWNLYFRMRLKSKKQMVSNRGRPFCCWELSKGFRLVCIQIYSHIFAANSDTAVSCWDVPKKNNREKAGTKCVDQICFNSLIWREGKERHSFFQGVGGKQRRKAGKAGAASAYHAAKPRQVPGPILRRRCRFTNTRSPSNCTTGRSSSSRQRHGGAGHWCLQAKRGAYCITLS